MGDFDSGNDDGGGFSANDGANDGGEFNAGQG